MNRSLFLVLSVFSISLSAFAYPGNGPSKNKLTAKETEQLWHMSEGADIFPLRWFMNLESVYKNKKVTQKTMVYERLSDKFGIVEKNQIYYNGAKSSWVSPMKWIGLTLAWNEPLNTLVPNEVIAQDFNLKAMAKQYDVDVSYKGYGYSDKKAASKLEEIDGAFYGAGRGIRKTGRSDIYGNTVDIPMVGTNCTFCHSTSVAGLKGKDGMVSKFKTQVFVEGAPNLLNLNGFFRDMIQSTLKTMVDETTMQAYIDRLQEKGLVPDNAEVDARALKLVSDFKGELEGIPGIRADGSRDDNYLVNLITALTSDGEGGLKVKMMKRALTMPGNRKTIATYLLKFLNLSYKTNEDHETQTAWIERLSEGLRQRMMWWTSLVGKSPDLPETPDGYGRSDAFGRIGNSTARKGEDGGIGEPIDLIAPASFPPMWGIEYTNLFHYNGNTNSVLMRNLGQSWGLGALVYQGGKGKVTSSNVANLARLEQLLYKIPYPKWNDSFGNTSAKVRVKKQRKEILQGCQVYVDKCMKCHGRHYTEDRVGERKRLIDNKVFALNQIHTDPNHAVIQGTPAKGLAFRQALFGATKTMVGEIKRLLNPSEAQLAQAENRPVRGKNQEHFRDPFVGENFEDFYSWLDGGDRSRKACGTAAHPLQYLEIAKKNAGGKCVKDAGRYGYIAKPLAGVWATAPYLHNGSVPNMEELLDPDKRRDLFYVGCRVYDTEKLGYVSSTGEFAAGGCSVEPESAFDVNYKFPSNQIPSVDGRTMGNGYNKTTDFNEHGQYVGGLTNGNYNGGHDTGAMVEKDPGKRRALITFLKVLAPPREHAWKGRSPYKIVNGVCK